MKNKNGKFIKARKRVPGVRYRMLLLVFICVIINYTDRSNMSIAGVAMLKQFHLNSVELGVIFSAFGWSYTFFQIPGGLILDRLGPRILYTISLFFWSLSTLFLGVVSGFVGLFGLRLSIGAFEAPSFPINNRIVTKWFPEGERGFATAIYTSGAFVGLAFLAPLLTTIQYFWGWRGLFLTTGGVGIVWVFIWFRYYREPEQHLQLTQKKHEKADGRAEPNEKKVLDKSWVQWRDLKVLFKYRKLWGIYIGQFAVNSTLWFFLTWFPTYLSEYRHINFLQSGFLMSIPFFAAFIGVLASGFLSDLLLRRGYTLSSARKIPVVVGLLLSTFIIGANYVNSIPLIVMFMSISFLGNGVASISWVFVSNLAPEHLIGSAGGIFNFMGNLAAVVVPIVIGFLVRGTNFGPALLFISTMAMLGIISYIFLVGKIEKIPQL